MITVIGDFRVRSQSLLESGLCVAMKYLRNTFHSVDCSFGLANHPVVTGFV